MREDKESTYNQWIFIPLFLSILSLLVFLSVTVNHKQQNMTWLIGSDQVHQEDSRKFLRHLWYGYADLHFENSEGLVYALQHDKFLKLAQKHSALFEKTKDLMADAGYDIYFCFFVADFFERDQRVWIHQFMDYALGIFGSSVFFRVVNARDVPSGVQKNMVWVEFVPKEKE